MARIVKEEEYAARRNDILDAAQRLVYTRGYEQMAIQDILDELHISKGAFYHYFDTKQSLMEAMIERIASQATPLMMHIVEDEHLSATEKLLKVFDFASRWKAARKEYLMTLVRVWYADDNAVLRYKSQAAVLSIVTPLIAPIIHQGINEGVFHTHYPELACEIVFTLLTSMGDSMIKLIVQPETSAETMQYLQRLTTSYQDAVERILGATPGSLPLFDTAILSEWFPASDNHK